MKIYNIFKKNMDIYLTLSQLCGNFTMCYIIL